MTEKTYALWWSELQPALQSSTDPNHTIYSLYGTHAIYGPNVLLYIGRTLKGVSPRLEKGHFSWIKHEGSEIFVRSARITELTTDRGWDDPDLKSIDDPHIVDAVVSLLIHANQPAYNSSSIARAPTKARGIRVMNAGRYGSLLPEASGWYYCGNGPQDDAKVD